MRCAVCDSTKIRESFRKQGCDYRQCASCGLIFRYPLPSETELAKIYDCDYYAPWRAKDGKESDIRQNKKETFLTWIHWIEEHVSPGSLLDVGCAMGYFLEVVQESGWQPWGVEISEYSYSTAARLWGERVFHGDLLSAHFAENRFDAVTMFDVIEHQADPRESFKEVHRVLKPGGVLLLSTADTRSLSCQLMGKIWPHFKPEHLYCFSRKNISLALQKSGFTKVQIRRARKVLSLCYVNSYFEAYPILMLTPALKALLALLPASLGQAPFRLGIGEMLVMAQKENA